MTSSIFTRDPQRFRLSNELHARPFPLLRSPCRAIFVAIRPIDAAERTLDVDHSLLIDLIDRYGGAHPHPDARHYSGELGRIWLKWESHTEFVTYTLFIPDVSETPFAGDSISMLPRDWLASVDGDIIAAAMVRVESASSAVEAERYFNARLAPCFVGESLALGFVLEDSALVASDFRLHEDGFARIAVIQIGEVGPDRLGRIVQRLLEIESYKSFSLLTLPVAREVSAKVTELDNTLAARTSAAASGAEDPRETLAALTQLAAEVERLSTETAFRFGAVGAYEAIVNDRIAVLRFQRMGGRQLFSEFMMRRFDPAMRTCRSAERRLKELSDRVSRASALLSTRVQVGVEAQNQKLLESMNRRAELQLRLQRTVEGLSVVAISYYAVSLAAYLLAPAAKTIGVEKSTMTALIVVPVVALVWFGLRRIQRLHKASEEKAD